jgi:hypothetical protein
MGATVVSLRRKPFLDGGAGGGQDFRPPTPPQVLISERGRPLVRGVRMCYRRGTQAGMLEPYDSTCYNAPHWCMHVVLRWAPNSGALQVLP